MVYAWLRYLVLVQSVLGGPTSKAGSSLTVQDGLPPYTPALQGPIALRLNSDQHVQQSRLNHSKRAGFENNNTGNAGSSHTGAENNQTNNRGATNRQDTENRLINSDIARPEPVNDHMRDVMRSIIDIITTINNAVNTGVADSDEARRVRDEAARVNQITSRFLRDNLVGNITANITGDTSNRSLSELARQYLDERIPANIVTNLTVPRNATRRSQATIEALAGQSVAGLGSWQRARNLVDRSM